MLKPSLKRGTTIILVITVFLGLFLLNVQKIQAVTDVVIEGLLGGLAESIVRTVAWWGLLIAGFLATIGALIFEGVLNFGFVNLAGVEMGWTICRDIANMFFILGLVVIAFGTILKIETYGMKALLPKLIIIALLINFSFLICGVIIDSTQIITNFFLGKIKGEPEGSIGIKLLDSLQVNKFFQPSTAESPSVYQVVSGANNFVRFVISVCFVALTLILTFIALIVGAILLLIRIGALWILMILAPFAWFFSIFPGLKTMAGKWWDNFLKYAFFAPIYVFFIYLIVYISPHIFSQAQTVYQKNIDQTFSQQLKAFALTEMAGNANLIFGFVFVVMLLLGAPVIATSMGLHATSAVVKGYQSILRGAARLPIKGIRYAVKSGLQKFDRDVLAPRGLSIRAGLEAWKLRKARVEEEKMRVPIGEMYDRLNRWFGEGKTFYAERERDSLRQTEQERIRKQSLSLEGVADIANESAKSIRAGKLHLVPKFQAAVMEAADRGDEEGLMGNRELGEKYKWLTSEESYQQLIKDTIADKEEAIRFAGQLGALAKQRGIHYLDGMTQYDEKQKRMVWTPTEEEIKADPTKKHLRPLGEKGAIELSKLSARYIYQLSNRRNFAIMDATTGDAKMPNRLLKSFLKRTIFDKAHLFDLEKYMAPETAHYLKPIVGEIQKLVNQIKAEDAVQGASAQTWLDTLKTKVSEESEEGEEKPKAPPYEATTA